MSEARGLGEAQLTDFGLSRVLGDLASHVSTRTYGTISFMPPELIRDAKLSKAADVYSYGILMWETYCSKTAYDGTPAATVLPRSQPSSALPLLPAPCYFGLAAHVLSREEIVFLHVAALYCHRVNGHAKDRLAS